MPRAAAQATPYTPPVTIPVTREVFFDECVTWNANNENGANTNWSFDAYGNAPSFKHHWDSSNPENDWLFLPDLQLEAAKYKLTYSYKCDGSSYRHSFNFTIGQGKNVEAQTKTLSEHIEAQNSSYVDNEVAFQIDAAGVYNLAIWAHSPKDQYYFYVKDIHIEKIDPNAPVGPAFGEITTDGLDVHGSLTLPSATVNDVTLPAATTVNVTLTASGIETPLTLTGAPGEVKTFDFTFPASGTYDIEAVAIYTDAEGSHTSQPATTTIEVTRKKPEVLELGYIIMPLPDEKDWMEIVDANDDHNTFYYTTSRSPYNHGSDGLYAYEPSETMAADDWLITPVWSGTPNEGIRLTYRVSTSMTGNHDYDVCVGYSNDINDLKNNVVFSETGLNTANYAELREVFVGVEANKPFYVAFHQKSPIEENLSASMYLGIMEVKCEETDGRRPAAATIGEITQNLATAGLSFDVTLPAKTIIGNNITAETVYASYTLNGVEKGILSGAPGETLNLSLNELPLGPASFTFTTYILDGETKIGDRVAHATAEVNVSDEYEFKAPFDFVISNHTVFNLFTVIDRYRKESKIYDETTESIIDVMEVVEEPDFKTWTFKDEGSSGCAQYSFHSKNAAEDWLISPAITIEDADEYYDLFTTFQASNARYVEKGELYWGTAPTPEAMTNLMGSFTSTDGDKHTIGGMVRFPQSGKIYIGVRACSDKDKYSLYCYDISLKEHTPTADAPAAASDIMADGKTTGENIAEVSFKFPTLQLGPATEDINGDDVIDDADIPALAEGASLVAVVTSADEKKTVTGTPGQEASLTIAAPAGESTITIQVIQKADETVEGSMDNPGAKTPVTVFCGVHQPAAPLAGEPVLDEDNLGFKLSWEAVTECANEGETHINAEGMKYRVYSVDYATDEKTLLSETDQTTADVRLADDDQEPGIRIYAVTAFNGLESASAEAIVIAGRPETLPMADDFAEGYAKGLFLVYGMGDYKDPAAEATASESASALFLDPDQDLYVELPKFSADGVTEGYVEFVFHSDAATAPALLTLQANGDAEPTELGTLAADETTGWKVGRFELPASILGKKAVSLKATLSIAADKRFVLDSYKVTNYKYVGLDNVEALDGSSARGLDGAILLQGFAGHQVVVAATDGRVVATLDARESTEILPAAPGLYVVSAPGFAVKVVVK